MNKVIKKLIKNCLPYALVTSIQGKNQNETFAFMNQYLKYIDGKIGKVSFDKQSKFKYIVDIQGFGWSGSSAVLDLLSEYSNTDVVGLIDNGSQAKQRKNNYEIELFRTAGGIFEVEKFIGKTSVNSNDALLHRLVLAMSTSPIYIYNEALRPYFYEFLSQISIIFSRNNKKNYFNGHLSYKGNNYMLYLKKMTLDQYHEIARGFATTLFNRLFSDSKKEILILDQVCGDDQRNLTFYRNYIPNIKSIFVYRDPRDVLYDAKHFDVDWIPYQNIDLYISWYRYCMQTFSLDGNAEYLVVRFEDLLYDYNNQVNRVEKYVGLSPEQHIYIQKSLDISVSRKNVGLWENDTEYSDVYNNVINELSEICYIK